MSQCAAAILHTRASGCYLGRSASRPRGSWARKYVSIKAKGRKPTAHAAGSIRQILQLAELFKENAGNTLGAEIARRTANGEQMARSRTGIAKIPS